MRAQPFFYVYVASGIVVATAGGIAILDNCEFEWE